METKIDYQIQAQTIIERGQAINESQAKDQYGSIPYKRHYTKIVGGNPAAAILLQQINYWWYIQSRKPFYKFKEPCSHSWYKDGDSWTEELAFSRSVFDTALKAIGAKVTKGQSKSELLNHNLVIYWTDANRVTWYQLNEKLFAAYTHLAYNNPELLGKVGKSLYLDKDGNLLYTSKEGLTLYLYSEITTEITTKNCVLTNAESDDSDANASTPKPDKSQLDNRGVFIYDFVDNEYTEFKCCCGCTLDVRRLKKTRLKCPICQTPIEIRDSHGKMTHKPYIAKTRQKVLGDIIPDCPEKLADIMYYAKQSKQIKLLLSSNRGKLLEALNWAVNKFVKMKMAESKIVESALTWAGRIDEKIQQDKSEKEKEPLPQYKPVIPEWMQ